MGKLSMAGEAVESLIVDLLDWIDARNRSYEEVLEAWRTSCPRLPVWADANNRGLVMQEVVNGRRMVGDYFIRAWSP